MQTYMNTKPLDEETVKSVMPMIRSICRSSAPIPNLDKEDLEGELLEQVVKSWQQYDPSQGAQFKTYLYPALCMRRNELSRATKAVRRGPGTIHVSLESNAYKGNEKGMCIAEIIEDKSSDLESKLITKDIVEVAADIVKDIKNEEIKDIIKLLWNGYRQSQVSRELKCSQASVNYHWNKFRKTLARRLKARGYDYNCLDRFLSRTEIQSIVETETEPEFEFEKESVC